MFSYLEIKNKIEEYLQTQDLQDFNSASITKSLTRLEKVYQATSKGEKDIRKLTLHFGNLILAVALSEAAEFLIDDGDTYGHGLETLDHLHLSSIENEWPAWVGFWEESAFSYPCFRPDDITNRLKSVFEESYDEQYRLGLIHNTIMDAGVAWGIHPLIALNVAWDNLVATNKAWHELANDVQ